MKFSIAALQSLKGAIEGGGHLLEGCVHWSRRLWNVCVAAQRFRFAHACGSRDAMQCS